MFTREIKQIAKKEKVDVFFDMDGVLVEFIHDPNKQRYNSGANFYAKNRPILTMIKIAKKLSKIPNVTVHVLSNCPLFEQIEEKKDWLKKNAPFFKPENIHIICYEKLNIEKADRPMLKGKFLKENFGESKIILIEDDLRNIKQTNLIFDKHIAYHISSLQK